MTRIEIDNPSCTEGMTEPHLWIVHIFELSFSILAIIGNCIIAVLSKEASPISMCQRKMLAAMSLNFTLLGCFQLSRNVFLTISMYNPCINLVSTISCKLQEFPLLFCYIHNSILAVILALQSKTKKKEVKRKLPWTATWGFWQSLIIVVAVGCTLIFTAFDRDILPENMKKCSILLAMRSQELGFWLLTFLIIMHTISLFVVSLPKKKLEHPPSYSTIMALSFKELLKIEILLWYSSFFLTGTTLLYNHVIIEPQKEIISLLLETSFVFLPLIISFIHPVLLIWDVFPMRDAAVRVFPILQTVLPEYTLVPPPPPKPKGSPMPVSKPVVIHMSPKSLEKQQLSPLLPKK